MLQPKKSLVVNPTAKKVLKSVGKTAKAVAVGQILSKIPGADEIYDVANLYEGFKEGDYKKIGSNFIGALIPGVSGKVFETMAEDWLPETPEIEKRKMQFNLKSSPAERQEYFKKYGAGYLSNPQFIKDQKLAYGTNQNGIMKKSMNPRKKYLNGSNSGGVTSNGIPTPASTLNDYNIMMAQAEQEAASNEWLPVVGMLGGLAQSAVSFGAQGGFNKTPAVPGAKAANGMNNVNADVEVEGGEMYETPQGNTGEFKGPSHEQGGIPMEVNQDIPEGTKVYSDRLKVGKETLAERKAKRERQIANLEKIATQPLVDTAVKNATKRKMEAIQREEMADLQYQEQVNNMQQMADTVVAAFGTSMEGLQGNPVGDSMQYGMGTGASGVTEYAIGGIIPGLVEGFGVDANYQPEVYGTGDVNNYNTETIKNLQAAIGTIPDGNWGPKSNTTFRNWQKINMPNKYANNVKNFGKNFNISQKDIEDGISSEAANLLGVTTEGYKFNGTLSPEANIETNPKLAAIKSDEAFYTPGQVGLDKRIASSAEDAAFYTPGQVGTAKVGKVNPKGTMLTRGLEKMTIPGVGDLTGLFGDYLGATSGLKNANESRATDVTHQNVYANVGKDSQKYLDNAMASVEGMKAQAEMKATTTTRGSKMSANNSARGVNQKRSLAWLYDQGLADSLSSISANAANQVSDLFKAKSSTAMSADQLKGQGEYQAAMANEAAKDAYYNAKGLGLKDQSLGIQSMGKDINAMKQNEMIEKLMKSGYGKWTGLDKNMKSVNGNPTSTKEEEFKVIDGIKYKKVV